MRISTISFNVVDSHKPAPLGVRGYQLSPGLLHRSVAESHVVSDRSKLAALFHGKVRSFACHEVFAQA